MDINRCSFTFDEPQLLLNAYVWIRDEIRDRQLQSGNVIISDIARVKNGFNGFVLSDEKLKYRDLKLNILIKWIDFDSLIFKPQIIGEVCVALCVLVLMCFMFLLKSKQTNVTA